MFNLVRHLWQATLDWLGLHKDIKKINALRIKVENLEQAHAKAFVRNPLSTECKVIREDIQDYKAEIHMLESKYPDWNSL